MIDKLCLMIGLCGVIFVVARAIMLDRSLPWFKPAPKVEKAKPSRLAGQLR